MRVPAKIPKPGVSASVVPAGALPISSPKTSAASRTLPLFPKQEVRHTVHGSTDLPQSGQVAPPGMMVAPPPANITYDNLEEWISPKVKFVPAPVKDAVEEAQPEPSSVRATRLARSVLREPDASRNAKKVARMLIDILEVQVPSSVAREPEKQATSPQLRSALVGQGGRE